MKLVSINTLKIGEQLGCDIKSGNGNLLLRGGTLLTERMITRLKTVGIYAVYIDDAMFDDVNIRFALTDETKSRALEQLETMYAHARRERIFSEAGVKKIAREIFEEVRISALAPINMISTFAIDNPMLLHSLNTATLTAAIAAKMNVRQQLAENYVIAALFHDLMLTDLSNEPNDLAEFSDTYRVHADRVYTYLKTSAVYDAGCYMAAALHHEKFDGTGVPRKIAGKQINEGARIIAVADMFDNISLGIAGYMRLPIHEAVEYVVAQSGSSLDPDIVKIFQRSIAVYPTGAVVTLNNGLDAMVLSQNEGLPTRPVVRLIAQDPADRAVFDMFTQSTLFIDKIAL